MRYDDMQALIDQAAGLLPEPPPAGNHDGYAAWAALTIETGGRLSGLLGADPDLLNTLLDDDWRTPAECRLRRRLLLSVALYTVRRQRRTALVGPQPRAVVVSDVIPASAARFYLPAASQG